MIINQQKCVFIFMEQKEAGLLDCFENLTSRVDDLAHQCKVLHTQVSVCDCVP